MFAMMAEAKQLYRYIVTELEQVYPKGEAESIGSLLFESRAGITRSQLVRKPDQQLDDSLVSILQQSLEELKNHKPVQYVTGEAWFYQMKLKVTPAVLIPRPETEELVAAVISYLKARPGASLLDIGTGSGCIPIAIRKSVNDVEVTAMDISSEALVVAEENARVQEAPVHFLNMDFLDEQAWAKLPAYDVIVSNPPYIPENEKESLDRHVTAYEPHLALFVESSRPLLFYEKIAGFGQKHLKEDGMIFTEVHEDLAKACAGMFREASYDAKIIKDLFGKERFVSAIRRCR